MPQGPIAAKTVGVPAASGAITALLGRPIDVLRDPAAAGHHYPSITQDRMAGLPTEWRARNEVVVRLARRHDIAVPLNEALTTLLRLGEPDT